MVCVWSHVYVYMCVHVPRQMCVKFEDNFQELVLSLYRVGFGTSTQVIKPQGKHLTHWVIWFSAFHLFKKGSHMAQASSELCLVKDNLDPLILLPPLWVWDYKCAPPIIYRMDRRASSRRGKYSLNRATPQPQHLTLHRNLPPYLGLWLAGILLSLARPKAFMNSPFAWGWERVDLGAEVNLKDRPPQRGSRYFSLESNIEWACFRNPDSYEVFVVNRPKKVINQNTFQIYCWELSRWSAGKGSSTMTDNLISLCVCVEGWGEGRSRYSFCV